VAILFIAFTVVDVFATIGPSTHTVAMPFVVFPFSVVRAAIGPSTHTVAMPFVVFVPTVVSVACCEIKHTVAIAFVVFVLAVVFVTFGVSKLTVAIPFVVVACGEDLAATPEAFGADETGLVAAGKAGCTRSGWHIRYLPLMTYLFVLGIQPPSKLFL
jgi:hypothetical protein